MRNRTRIERLEASIGACEAVNALLTPALEYEDMAAYRRACLRLQPAFQPLDWILDRLEECVVQGSGRTAQKRARLSQERRDARLVFRVALELLEDGESWFARWFSWTSLLSIQLAELLGTRTPTEAYEFRPEDIRRVAREARIVLHGIELQTRARAAIEERYFGGRSVRFAASRRDRERVSSTAEALHFLLDELAEVTSDAERETITDETVDVAVRTLIQRVNADLVVELDGPAAAIPYLRELLLDDEELAFYR